MTQPKYERKQTTEKKKNEATLPVRYFVSKMKKKDVQTQIAANIKWDNNR